MEKQPLDHLTNPNLNIINSPNLVNIISLKALVDGYILNCRCEGKSPETTHTYEEHLRRFLWYCRQQNFPDDPQKLNASHLRNFFSYIASEPVRWNGSSTSARLPATMSTVGHYYRVLKTFWGWLKREGLITDNPLDNVKRPKTEQKIVQALTPKEVQKLISLCSAKTTVDTRNKAIIMMFLDTGLRVFELAALKLSDINMDTGTIFVGHGKGNKQRMVRIGSITRKALWHYVTLYRKGESELLFLTKTKKPLNTGAIKLMIKRLGKKAGIPNVHVHRMRHTFAISFLRAGGDIFTLQYLLGHSNLSMVQRYLKSLNADDAFKAHQKYSPIDNLKD